MPPSRNPQPPQRKKRRHEDSRRKAQRKGRYSNHTDLDDLASRRTSASAHLAQVRITRPVGTFRNIKESKRASRGEDGSYPKETLKKRVEQDLQSILSSSELRRPTSPGPSRRLLPRPTLRDDSVSPPSRGRSSVRTPVSQRQIVNDNRSRTSGSRPEATGRTSTQRPIAEASSSEGDRKSSATEKEVVTKTVSHLQTVLAEKCRILYPTTDILQSVRRVIRECCLEEEASDHGVENIAESDSEGSVVAIVERGEGERGEEAPRNDSRRSNEHYSQPKFFPSDVRSPSPAGSNAVASFNVLFQDGESTRRSQANGRAQRDRLYGPPLPSPIPRDTGGHEPCQQARPPSGHCSSSRQIEWIDLTESPPGEPPGMPPSQQHAFYKTSSRLQYDAADAAGPVMEMLPGYGSDILSDDDLVPPSPPVQRPRRRLTKSSVYSPIILQAEQKEDLDDGWYYVPQKMF